MERGNLLTLPLGGGLVYVEPVYVKSSGATSSPLLKKVLVAFGDQVGFANTLNEALNQVFDGNSGAQAGDGGNQGSGGNPSDSGAAGDNADGSGSTANTNRNPELSQALQDAGKAMKDADSAMKKGDWSGYGEAQKRLEEALDKAMALDK